MARCLTKENSSQEALNAWTHGAGFLISLPAGIALNRFVIEQREQLVYACLAYSLSLSGMYLFSTLSHAVRNPDLRHRVRAWDQGMIYALIAGTFTPFTWAYMEGWARIALLAFVWIAAATGFYSKVLAQHRINNMTSVSYVLLGWIPAMVLLGHVSLECFATMAFGGVLYTFGTLFLQNDHRSWCFHAIWHLMVILASACHYIAIIIFPILQLDRQ